MKYIDTNVIVRLITNDVPELAKEAIDMLDSLGSEEVTVLDAVITEVCFVLEFNSAYNLPRSVIYDGLYVIFDSVGAVRGEYTDQALDMYVAHPKLDYTDCLLCSYGIGRRTNVLTFDKELTKALAA
jgi:predicted nucleic acid-binding protein